MSKPVWLLMAQAAGWAISLALIAAWMARSRERRAAAEHLDVLRHPPSTLIVGCLGGGLFLALALWSVLVAAEEVTWRVRGGFLGGALLGGVTVAMFFRVEHRAGPDGLAYRPLIGRAGFLHWRDVRAIGYSELRSCFRIETRDGRTVRISVLLRGLPGFARWALAGISPENIEPETRSLLEATREGRLPWLS